MARKAAAVVVESEVVNEAGVSAGAGMLDAASIEVAEVVELGWMRVGDAVKSQAEGNPKLHDIEKLAAAIWRDGFTDPPKWDSNLNHGEGGFVYGNGRLEALDWMEARHREFPDEYPVPRGIGVEKGTSAWVLPVKMGLNAESIVHAQQQLIDHNNLTLAGAGLDALEIARIYDQAGYMEVLRQIEAGIDDGEDLALTVGNDDFAFLSKVLGGAGNGMEFQSPESGISLGGEYSGGFSEGEGDDLDQPAESSVRMFQLFLDTDTHPEMMEMIEALNPTVGTTNPTDCILAVMRKHYGQQLTQQ